MKNLIFLLSWKVDTMKYNLLSKVFESAGAILSIDPKQDYDVVLFPPGEDVNPFLYGQKRIDKVQTNYIRDRIENDLYRSIPEKKPIVGIGRGAQLLNVLNGGKLYQHVTGHVTPHLIIDYMTGNELMVNSYHHQEMIPPSKAWIMAAASAADRKVTPDGTSMIDYSKNRDNNIYLDTEVAYLQDKDILMFQPDPTLNIGSVSQNNTWNYFSELMEEWLIPETQKKNKKVA